MKLRYICLLLIAFAFRSAHAQESTPISPGVFVRGLQIASGVRYTASFIKPTDDTAMRNLSVEVTLPADAQFTEMLVSRQVEFDVIRRNRQGQLTLIWQISRVPSDAPLDAFAFTVASPLSQELEFYLQWQDGQGQTFVDNFFELPSTLRADDLEASLISANADFVLAGNSGILVSSTSPNPLNFRVLPNNFNPPPEYGRIWWCSLVELSGLGEGESATVIVPLRRPVAPFTELILFQQQADESWLALEENGVVTADGQFVMYQHTGGLIATGGDEEIQQQVVKAEDAEIEDEAPPENQESESPPQNDSESQNESQPEPAENNEEAPPQQNSPPESNQNSTDGTSNTIIISEATSAPPPVQSNNDGTSNTIIISEPTSAPAPTLGSVSDGTSNTIIIGEVTPAPTLGSNNDGSSNTIIIGEVTPAPTLGNSNDGSSNTIIIGEPTSAPAPTLGSISDGTSNTIIIGEATFTPTSAPTLGSISDGTSNTIIIGEFTPSPAPTQGSVSDGSSNTIIIGEATFTPTSAPTLGSVSDGTSNTIIIGEVTPAPTLGSSNDGSSNTIIIGEFTPSPAPTQGSISDVTSNTIIIGEFTPSPAPTQGSVSDGTSNTIVIGEATFTPTSAPTQAAVRSTPVSAGEATLIPVATQVVVISKPIPAPFGAGGVRVVILRRNIGQFVQCQVGSILCAPLQRRAGAGLRT